MSAGAPALTTGSDPSLNHDDRTPIADKWGYMRVQVAECDYKWTIDNFTLREEKTGTAFWSPAFSANSDDQTKWCLQIYPQGIEKESKDYVSLLLLLVSSPKTVIRAKWKVSVLSAKGKEIATKVSGKANDFRNGTWSEYPKFVERDFLLTNAFALLPDDKLTIYCEVSAIQEFGDILLPDSMIQFDNSICKLLQDMGTLFKDKKFNDIVLSAGGKDFFVHKAVLAARSPVFAAMFEHEMKEKKENQVDIRDMCPEVLEEMLRYIYTGKTENIRKLAEDLLVAADKYDLGVLKEICGQVLCSNLTIDNVVDTLIIADSYNAKKLKSEAVNFIVTHAADVIDTAGWKNIVPTHPHLIEEIFRASLATK